MPHPARRMPVVRAIGHRHAAGFFFVLAKAGPDEMRKRSQISPLTDAPVR
jgi:hypothetical protein